MVSSNTIKDKWFKAKEQGYSDEEIQKFLKSMNPPPKKEDAPEGKKATVLSELPKKVETPKVELPKGLSLLKKEVPPPETNKDERGIKAIQDIALATQKAVEGTERVARLNVAAIEVMIEKILSTKEQPITVNIPETKMPKDWKEAEITISERDINGYIKRISFRKVQ